MLDWKRCGVVEQTAGKISGAWLFKDTRVPVEALFENLKDGATVTGSFSWVPGVTLEQARAVLVFAAASLVAL